MAKVKKVKKQQLKTLDVIERLAIKYPSPQYGFVTELRNGTGFLANRSIDAVAMSLWPSRGLHLNGFEIKVSRGDWLTELKNPEKAEVVGNYFHYWYLVIGDEDIVKDGELPNTWGLIVPRGKGLKIIKEAHFNSEPQEIDYLFLAGVFRNLTDRCIARDLIQTKLNKSYEDGGKWYKEKLEYSESKVEKLEESIKTFEKVSGIELSTWGDNKEIGLAVKEVLEGRDKDAVKRLQKLLVRAKNIVKYIEGEDIISWDC